MITISACSAFLFFAAVLQGATIYVPDDFPTIQGAIEADATSNGDTIMVKPGTYAENIDFIGKAIRVASTDGPEATVIDAHRFGSVVTFQNGEGPNSILEGFTIQNGAGTGISTEFYRGGGIYCVNGSSPTIIGNIIRDNDLTGEGCGICCIGSSPTVVDNVITENFGYMSAGGAVYSYEGSPMILDNEIVHNGVTYGGGGGIYLCFSAAIIDNNVIARNGAAGHISMGGGIFAQGETVVPVISNNLIDDNWADWGGGIQCFYCSPEIFGNTVTANGYEGISCYGDVFSVISDNVIERNLFWGIECSDGVSSTIKNNIISENGDDWGGGISCDNSDLVIVNNIITKNRADVSWGGYGGGISASGLFSTLTITNNVIAGNTTIYEGAGISLYGAIATVTNTILWNNNGEQSTDIWIGEDYWGHPAEMTILFSDLEGGQSSVVVESGCTLNWGAGMIDADPLFVDYTGDDFHLTWPSPCRDSGDNSSVTETEDFEGDPRIALGTVDMGADEFYYHLYHAGQVIPGNLIDLKVVGYPSAPITLFLGDRIQDPPYTTQHGDFWLQWPPLWQGGLGKVPGNGVLIFQATVPPGWVAGEQHPLQALVGPWGGQWTWFTNLMNITVE